MIVDTANHMQDDTLPKSKNRREKYNGSHTYRFKDHLSTHTTPSPYKVVMAKMQSYPNLDYEHVQA